MALAELNPFQAPSEKPRTADLTDRQRLALPESARARHAFGDRFYWPLLILMGLFLFFIARFLRHFSGFASLALTLFSVGMVVRALVGWVRGEGD